MKNKVSKYMLDSQDEVIQLGRQLKPYGIHLETDLFGIPYIILDHQVLRQFHKSDSFNHTENERRKR